MISGKEMHMKKFPQSQTVISLFPCRHCGISAVMQKLTGGEKVSVR